jgi:hypothetical protein
VEAPGYVVRRSGPPYPPHGRLRQAADAFDLSAFSSLAAIAVPAGEALPRLEGSETLVSNLLEVTGFAPQVHSASTPCRDRADAWERMRSNGAFEGGFHLSGGQIHTLASLEDGPLAVLCHGPVTSVATAEWSDSGNDDVRRRFVALLNFTLRSAHHPDLVWHPKKKIVYYQASSDLSKRKVQGRYRGSKGRAFFAPYRGKDDVTKVSFCRHYAAGLYFCRWAGQWFLEINPTYHFTIDGRRDSFYDAEYVAKIKRMERNSAVYQLVRAWADYLQGEDTLFKSRDERILFGGLLTVEAGKPGRAPSRAATSCGCSRTRPPGHGTCTSRCTTRPAARPGGCRAATPTCPPAISESASTERLTARNSTPPWPRSSTSAATASSSAAAPRKSPRPTEGLT